MGKHKHDRKKHKKEKQKDKKSRKYNSSSSSTEEEWVEKIEVPVNKLHDNKEATSSKEIKRDDWMSMSTLLTGSSNIDRKKEREVNKRLQKEKLQYNPCDSVRELNPYWKDGGDGLPSTSKFKIPADGCYRHKTENKGSRKSNWRKNLEHAPAETNDNRKTRPKQQEKIEPGISNVTVGSEELNILAAKIVKAEILGNMSLAAELKEKLENARKIQTGSVKSHSSNEDIILTTTDSKGYSKPLHRQSDGECGNKKKKQKVETHREGSRVRYFADDDKYSLKQMFENEKFNSVEEQNKEFVKLSGRLPKHDDMDDIFVDNIRKKDSDQKIDDRNKDRAITEHQKISQCLENCRYCLQSENMLKHLMVTMGETVYLSLSYFEPLTDGHCLIIPVRHVPCATQLDENEWSELLNFRKAVTRMFSTREEDVIFFETAMFFNHHPHMAINCVPLRKEHGDLAPIYFKKAIDESEMEWSSNKKLISLSGKDVRRAVPKGLPYFSVSFGMEEGYAHVIEDQRLFPSNFAPEVIGGILDLHHSKWRKPKRQTFEEQNKRVLEFCKLWSVHEYLVK